MITTIHRYLLIIPIILLNMQVKYVIVVTMYSYLRLIKVVYDMNINAHSQIFTPTHKYSHT